MSTGSCAVSKPVPHTASPACPWRRRMRQLRQGGGGFASAGWLAGGGDQGVLPSCRQMAAGSVTPCCDSRGAATAAVPSAPSGRFFFGMKKPSRCGWGLSNRVPPCAMGRGTRLGGPGADVPACMAGRTATRRPVFLLLQKSSKNWYKLYNVF